MKRAYIVTGAESTGTKLITQLLVGAGCSGDGGNIQWVLEALRLGNPFDCEPVVLRLSMPHGLDDPDLASILWHFKCLGYAPKVIVTTRDWWATTEAHLDNNTHGFNRIHSEHKKMKAYLSIFNALEFTHIPFMIAPYESIVARPAMACKRIVEWCGLSITEDKIPDVFDANAKRYGEGASRAVVSFQGRVCEGCSANSLDGCEDCMKMIGASNE